MDLSIIYLLHANKDVEMIFEFIKAVSTKIRKLKGKLDKIEFILKTILDKILKSVNLKCKVLNCKSFFFFFFFCVCVCVCVFSIDHRLIFPMILCVFINLRKLC